MTMRASGARDWRASACAERTKRRRDDGPDRKGRTIARFHRLMPTQYSVPRATSLAALLRASQSMTSKMLPGAPVAGSM